MEEAAKTAKTSAESVSKSGEKLGKTGAFKAISQVWCHPLWSRYGCFLGLPNKGKKKLNMHDIMANVCPENNKPEPCFLVCFLISGHGECEERDW